MLTSLISAFGLAAWSSAAAANDVATLDPLATSPGNLVENSAGTADVTWTHQGAAGQADMPMFCAIPAGGTCTAPIDLPIPGAVSDSDAVSGVFPVLGPGNTVYVVGPRYGRDDVILWTSTNGGASFGAGVKQAEAYSGKTDPSAALRSGTNILIGANNSGLGFSVAPVAGGAGTNLTFASPGEGGVAGSSLGLDSSDKPVEAYWNISSPPYGVFFYRYKGAGSTPAELANEANWAGPTAVSAGYEPALAGGASGLFLVSQDYTPGAQYPSMIDLRKYNGTGFEAPLTLANDASTDLFDGGAIAQSPGGVVAVAWPGTRGADQASVMRLFTSTNGGASFGESEVAHLGSAYSIDGNAQLAVGDSGQGWLTYSDAAGLQLANLSPIAPAPSTTAKPVPSKPKTYTGATKTISTPAGGGNLITLKVPKTCLASQQPFYVGVGKKVRHKIAKALRSKLKVVKVTFSFDGQKKTLKKKPFRWLITPGVLTPGKKYLVKARVTALVTRHGHAKRVVKTLKGAVSVC